MDPYTSQRDERGEDGEWYRTTYDPDGTESSKVEVGEPAPVVVVSPPGPIDGGTL